MVTTPPFPGKDSHFSLQFTVTTGDFSQNQSAGARWAALHRFPAALRQPLAGMSPGQETITLHPSASPPNPGHDSGPQILLL